jgi:multisubunit Na+/H+ antiporter MnhC subunit
MSVSFTLVAVMAVLYACGIYLMLERSMTRVLIGFLLVGNATNLLILVMAGRARLAPFADPSVTAEEMTDPLPHALILPSIVITFGVSAFLMALIYRSWRLSRVDLVPDDVEDLEISRRTTTEEDVSLADDTEFGTAAEAAVSSARALAEDDLAETAGSQDAVDKP